MQTFYWACGNLGRGGAMRSNYTHSEIDVRRANLSELGSFVSDPKVHRTEARYPIRRLLAILP